MADATAELELTVDLEEQQILRSNGEAEPLVVEPRLCNIPRF